MNILRSVCCLLPVLAIGCTRLGAEISEADVNSAVLKTKSVNYFGGMTVTLSITSEKAEFERVFPSITKNPPVKATIQLTKTQRESFKKILSIILREELWKQKDVTEKAVDGGERIFEFQVGKNKGKFKLINAAPNHLLPFLRETQQLISSIDEAVKKK